ncbi:MAG TPA: CoA-binding protein [Vicinamibacterales bacterium]|nr:CoA-binding protein [Vicinamibacterales bacterium]
MPRLRRSSATYVREFFALRTLAFVGASRNSKKFANMAYRDLRAKGYTLIPVNPHAESIEGDRCYPSLTALPQPVEGAVIMVPPSEAASVVRDAAAAGIRRVWLQQGAESPAALDLCDREGISAVAGECVLMFAEPAQVFHRVHRFGRKLLGTLPR